MMRITRGAKRIAAPDLFLSYSSKDKAIVRELALDLARCGVDSWLDEWELQIGQSLSDVLASALTKARFIAVVMTENYLGSPWTKTEFGQAVARQHSGEDVVILPLLLSGEKIPPLLADRVYLDFRNEYYYRALATLVVRIHHVTEARMSHALGDRLLWSIESVWEVLRAAGFQPFVVADNDAFQELVRLGGEQVGNDEVWFSPNEVCSRLPGKHYLKMLLEPLKGDNEK